MNCYSQSETSSPPARHQQNGSRDVVEEEEDDDDDDDGRKKPRSKRPMAVALNWSTFLFNWVLGFYFYRQCTYHLYGPLFRLLVQVTNPDPYHNAIVFMHRPFVCDKNAHLIQLICAPATADDRES